MLRRNSRLIGRSPSHIVRPIQWDHAKGCFRLRSTSPRQDPPSLYQVLGAQEGATPEEIKAAFRRKARDLHPDVNPLPTAAAQFQGVVHAYSVLSKPDKRLEYDQHLMEQRMQGQALPMKPPPPEDTENAVPWRQSSGGIVRSRHLSAPKSMQEALRQELLDQDVVLEDFACMEDAVDWLEAQQQQWSTSAAAGLATPTDEAGLELLQSIRTPLQHTECAEKRAQRGTP